MHLQSSSNDKTLKSNYKPVLPVIGNNLAKGLDDKKKKKFQPLLPIMRNDVLAKTKPKYKISRTENKNKKNSVNKFLSH